ncbi:MAG TPA: hypothetical protein VIP08_11730, partial [Phenylobacterium sp.]
RLRVEGVKQAHIDAARRALAMRLANPPPAVPKPGRTAGKGMRQVESRKVSSKTAPAKVGSVSQATKKAQAKRDQA